MIYLYQDSEDNTESLNSGERMKANKGKKPKSLCEIILGTIIPSLMILTLTFLTYLGLYFVLNNMTNPVQTVTVSSEGPAAEMHPDYMGQYNVLKDIYRYDRAAYKHVDRQDRFIFYIGRSYTLHVERKCFAKKKQLATLIIDYILL